MNPIKTTAICDWPALINKKELQQFLGFCNFYHQFIQNYSAIAKPLNNLTRKVKWQWTLNEHLAYECLIHAITSGPVLHLLWQYRQFQIEADSSDYAIGAVLSQLQDG